MRPTKHNPERASGAETVRTPGRRSAAAVRRPLARALVCAALLLGRVPFAHAAIAYVANSVSNLVSSETAAVTITAPAGLVTGEVMIAFLSQNTNLLPPVISAPSGWTQVIEKDDGSSIGAVVYYRVATAADVGGITQYTWSFAQAERSAGLILAFSGVSSSTPVVVSAGQTTAGSGTYTAPSVTPGITNTMGIALYAADNGNGGVNSPAGTTQAFVGGTGSGPNGLVIGAFYEALSGSGATGQFQSSANTSANNLGITLALQPGGPAAPDHYALSYPNGSSAVNCQAQPVTITAHTSAHVALATTNTIAVSTSTGHGDWSLTTGGGVFIAGASNSGLATYAYVGGDTGAVVLSLKDTYPETVTIHVTDGIASETSGSATASEHQTLTFAPSGFRITNGSNVATIIGTRVAGLSSAAGSGAQALALQAIRTDTNTGACTAVFASGQTVNVSLAYQCNNPAACVAGQTFGVTNNGVTTNIAANPNTGVTTWTSVPLKFSTANAEAPIAVTYSDVGQVTLSERYNIPLGSGAGSGNTMNGSSQFVVQPYNFVISGIQCTTYAAGSCNTGLGSPGNNPAAATAGGTVFLPAGSSFTATVTAINALGAATPNFGQETPAQGVTLTPSLVLPAGGHNPPLTNPSAFGAFSAGSATGTSFSWPEAGSITLTPSVKGGSYLGSGNVTGTATGNVGRFIPASFGTALNTPAFGTGCSAGSFTWIGQPFTYTVAPVLTATALAADGVTTTQNYTGALFKLTNSTLTGRTYTASGAGTTLNTSGLPATTADPVIVDVGGGAPTAPGAGTATLTFSAGTGLYFNHTSPVVPFNANIALSINVIDLDGVAAANPVTFGSGSGIAFSAGASQYYGRLAVRDTVGSELLDLPVAMVTQYYLSGTQGFTTNTADQCTTAPQLAMSGFQGSLTAGNTCVRDSGSPGASGLGCAAAAPAGNRYLTSASGGGFNLILAAPGQGHSGSATLQATAPAWLQYPWNASAGASNPTGLVTFGVFPGPASRIYQREVY